MTLTAITGLDHFVIRVPELDAAEAQYSRLGFRLTARGFHAGRGSANHTVPLSGGNYFELLAFAPGHPAAFSATTPADFAGPVAIALQTSDSTKVHAELTQLGFDVPAPRDLSRPVELPAGAQLARFLNCSFPPVEPASVSLFACEQRTRDLVWRPEWEDHPNGAEKIVELVIVHPTPAALQAQYARLFAPVGLSETDSLRVMLGETPLSILSPRAFAARYPAIPLPADLSQGWFAGAAFATASLAQLQAVLDRAGVTSVAGPNGQILVPPADGCGTLLAFQER